ncbi:putative MFS transporter [Fistulina hepatica ATCC 64428]|nr:putative MFS transporter [Fistulina hepatica ATCC 64428]
MVLHTDAMDSTKASPSSETNSVKREQTVLVTDHAAERALCRKFDFRILPMLVIMYAFNAMDKGNMGNAKTNGLEESLHLHGNQYNVLLSLFYIPYVLSAPPLTFIGKKFGPSRVLPILMICFGSFTLLVVAATNFAGLLVLRLFLGLAEGAFFPLVIHYLTLFYRRGELGRRLAIFYAANTSANAFSGLLAYGLFHIKDSHLASWRYLFVVEGCCTVLFAIAAWFILPASAAEASFLSKDEKALAYHRMQTDSSSVVNQKFVWRDALTVFKLPVVWVYMLIEMCLGVPLQSVALFLPQIIQRLGYSTVLTNLYTVAPNIAGSVFLVILGFASDYTRLRFPFVVLGFLVTFAGFMIYVAIDVEHSIHVAYFATFLMCMGTSPPSVLTSTWYNNNFADEGKRVAITAIGVPVANVMGIVSSNIFLDKDAPKYIPALSTTAAFGGLGALFTLSLGFWMIANNKWRDRKQGYKVRAEEVATKGLEAGPDSPDFRWLL